MPAQLDYGAAPPRRRRLPIAIALGAMAAFWLVAIVVPASRRLAPAPAIVPGVPATAPTLAPAAQ